MRECLREVAEVLSAWTNLFRIEPEMVGVSQKFLKQQLSLFQLSSARQAFDVPKRACSEAALSARKPVHVGAFRLVATDKGVFYEPCFNRFHCRAPHRIDRANEPHEWHKQDRRIQVLAPLRLYQ